MTCWVITPALAFVMAGLLTTLFLARRWHWAIDHPNERSLHSNPTPRTGGVALLAAVAATSVLAATWLPKMPWIAFGLALGLALLSLLDDRSGLPVSWRLAGHFGAAVVYCIVLSNAGIPAIWFPITVLAITAMTNFYNFMDGANGMAGGMAVAGFGTYGVAAFGAAPAMAMFCLCVSAAAAGFLCQNLRGRVFMGDSGSVPLGFLAASIGLLGIAERLWPFWFPLLAFAPFVADAGATLVRRVLRGDRFWEAHREHYYQRMVRMGWSHSRLALAEYALMCVCAGSALLVRDAEPGTRNAVLAAVAFLLTGSAVAVDYKWSRYLSAQRLSP